MFAAKPRTYHILTLAESSCVTGEAGSFVLNPITNDIQDNTNVKLEKWQSSAFIHFLGMPTNQNVTSKDMYIQTLKMCKFSTKVGLT